MQVKREQLSPTTIKLSISADKPFLDAAKQAVVGKLAQGAKVPGFRPGKAPANLVEKQLDPAALQSEFIDQAINQLYIGAIEQEKLRPAAAPQIALSKFVPYSTLEFTAEVEVVGDVKLADYTKIRLAPKKAEVTAKDVAAVLDNLRQRAEGEAKPKLDDAFASTIGPFKTLAELKADIRKQLKAEKQQEANRAYENELLQKIADKSTVAVPKALVDEEINRIEDEDKRNTAYRGQTWQEHLDAEGVDAEGHREKQRPAAELRVKAGLVLGEIADQEKVTVTPEELDLRIQLLKGQYPDPAMQAELDKPENRRDIMSRLLTEKTLAKLVRYASAKA